MECEFRNYLKKTYFKEYENEEHWPRTCKGV